MTDETSRRPPDGSLSGESDAPAEGASAPKPRPELVGPAPAQPFILNAQPIAGGLPSGLPITMQQVQVWQGQFPPPEAIERYERVMPGAFDRLMRMAERQQDASFTSTAEARLLLQQDTRRGHWLGWSVALGSIIGAIACAYLKQPIVATALVGVPVLSVARALIDGARAKPSPSAVAVPASGSDHAQTTPDASTPGDSK